MKNKLILAAIFTIVSFSAQYTSAQTKIRVRFPAGTHGTTVKGTVRGSVYKDYLVGSSAGQTMEVKLTSTGNPSVFTVFNPDGTNLDIGAEREEFTGELPTNGDYVVRVLMMRNEARRKNSASNYILKISVR